MQSKRRKWLVVCMQVRHMYQAAFLTMAGHVIQCTIVRLKVTTEQGMFCSSKTVYLQFLFDKVIEFVNTLTHPRNNFVFYFFSYDGR